MSVDYFAWQSENRTVSIAEFQARQQAAIHKAKQGVAQIAKAKPYLSQQDYEYLHGAFEKATVRQKSMPTKESVDADPMHDAGLVGSWCLKRPF